MEGIATTGDGMRLIRIQAALMQGIGIVPVLALLLLPFAVAAMATLVLLWARPDTSLEEIWTAARASGRLPQIFGLFVLAAAGFAWPFLSFRYEAVTVDADGIGYGFTPPRLLARLTRVWRVRWDELRGARMELQLGNRPMLRLDTAQGVRSLALLEWVDAGQRQGARFWSLFKPRFDQQMARAQESPLWHALTARGIAIAVPDRARAIEADLFANRYTLFAVIAILVLGLYGFMDFVLVEEAYVAGYPKVAVFGLGAAAALLATLVLWWRKVKPSQAMGVGAMLGLAVGFAAVPGLLRVNALTDTNGPRPHAYILQAHTRLVSHEPNLPTVIFKHDRDYWSLFAVGSEHRLYLRRGGLGFEQVHLTPLYADMRLRLGPQCRR